VTIDLSVEELEVLQREADKQHRPRKDQIEYIVERWVEDHSREKR